MKYRRIGSRVYVGVDMHVVEITCQDETESVTLLYNLYRRAKGVRLLQQDDLSEEFLEESVSGVLPL